MLIYKATNKVNNKIYIGKTTKELKCRIKGHLDAVKKNSKTYFHNALRKYGIKNFRWRILVLCRNETELSKFEKMYIAKYKKQGRILYNHTEGGDGSLGYKHSKKTKKKMKIFSKNNWKSEEYRKKQKEAYIGKYGRNKGVHLSEEVRLKISKIQKGKKRKPHTEIAKEKMRRAKIGNKNPMYHIGKKHPNYGKTFSEELRKKLSIAHMGQKAWNKGIPCSEETKLKIKKSKMGTCVSEETRKKISMSNKGKHKYWLGKTRSEETKRKISKGNKGKIRSEETRQKIKKYWHKYHDLRRK